jgi:hypothetical protein
MNDSHKDSSMTLAARIELRLTYESTVRYINSNEWLFVNNVLYSH